MALTILSDLLPYMEQRDEASTVIAKQDNERQRICDQLTTVQVETQCIARRNVELASEVLRLAGTDNQNKAGSIVRPATKDALTRLEKELKASRQKWKVMKGTASAVVAGSGVDWAKNPDLRNIVLDPD